MLPGRHVSISIDCAPADAYAFIRDGSQLPSWAKGLAGSITARGDGSWLADAPMGQVIVRFAEDNAFGIVDHDVMLPSGQTVHNAMRVLPNGDGCEVVFSLFQLPGMDATAFEADAQAVSRDLVALKALLEATGRR